MTSDERNGSTVTASRPINQNTKDVAQRRIEMISQKEHAPLREQRGVRGSSSTGNTGPSYSPGGFLQRSRESVRAALGGSGIEAEFRDAMVAAGLQPPAIIEADGNIHRFSGDSRPGDDSCWYVLHTDGVPAGAYGDWRTGLSETWFKKNGHKLSPRDVAARRDRITVAKRKAKAEGEQRKAVAANSADSIWSAAAVADDSHPYFARKGVKAHGPRLYKGALVVGGMPCDGALVVPMRDTAGALHSLQFIATDGTKRYLPGGRVSGCDSLR